MTSRVISFVILILLCVGIRAQEHHGEDHEDAHAEFHRHHVAVGIGYAFIPGAGELNGSDARGLFIPSVGADYFFQFNERWALGLALDYELDHYLIIDRQLEREHALILALLASYRITGGLRILAGGGMEFEAHEHLGVIRAGLEYEIHLGGSWGLVPRLFADLKQHYSSFTFGVGIVKMF